MYKNYVVGNNKYYIFLSLSLRHTNTLTPVLNVLNGATQLLEAYENSPGAIKMPRMLQLVKQLKKELNIHKVMKDQKKKPGMCGMH